VCYQASSVEQARVTVLHNATRTSMEKYPKSIKLTTTETKSYI